MSDLATSAVIDERRDVIEYVTELLDEHFRHGSADVRVVLDGVPYTDWLEIDAEELTRYPDGAVKVERPCIGVVIEYVPEREA